MIRYYLRKLLIFALSMVIALCLFLLAFGSLTVGLFYSDSYIESGLMRNSDAIIATVDERLEKTAEELELPPALLTDAVSKDNIRTITGAVAHNFVYSYTTSFSNSTELYNLFAASVSAGAPQYQLKLSDAEIGRIASCAVDAVNEAIGSTDTASVTAFRFVRSRTMMTLIIVSVIAIIAAIVALDFLNNGRHRKYNYIGMGLTVGGAAAIAFPLAAVKGGVLSGYRFCSFDAYNLAIKYCFTMAFNIMIVVGVIYLIIGVVMLFVTYQYFRRKKEIHDATRLNSDDTLTDYMDDYYTKNVRTHKPGEEFEKEVKKIDFE